MTAHSRNLSATKQLISKIIHNQNSEEELDGLYLVCGEEGSGKSNTILLLSEVWEKSTSNELSIDCITRNLLELFQQLKKNQRWLVALDEGYELKSTNMWDKMVKKVEKAYMIGRYRANLSLIAYTNPFKINSYFKEDRAKGIFFCYKRKIILYYSRNALRDIRAIMNKAGNIKSINDLWEISTYRKRATFIEYNAPKYIGHLAEAYKKRKIDNYQLEMDEMDEEEVKTYSLNKTCKMLGVTRTTISECIEQKVFVPEWNATRTKMRITDEDITKMKQYLITQQTQKS